MEKKIKILVADDDKLMLTATCDALKRAGFDVIPVGPGLQVYQQIVKNHPDVALLDIMMPEIDGIEICRNLKRAPKTKDILVIIYSSKTDAELMDLCHSFGADAYIIKSGNFDQMVQRVKELIQDKLGKETGC